MAKIFNSANLTIKYDCGMDLDGKSIIKSKSYNGVENGADPLKLMAIVNAIAGLQDNTLFDALVSEKFSIM